MKARLNVAALLLASLLFYIVFQIAYFHYAWSHFLQLLTIIPQADSDNC